MLKYIDLNKTMFQVANAANVSGQEIAGETASELASLIQIILTKIPLWIAAFIVIFLAVIVAKIARSMVVSKIADKIEEEHQEIEILGGRITYVTVLTIGITVGLKIAGIDLTSIIAAAAFGVGFALKDLIMNFLAGMMILISRHFTIGDFINIGGTLGKVIEIQSRVTVLQAIDGTKVIVPNADLFKKKVISYTSNPFRRVDIVFGVDYRSNLENVIRVVKSVLKDTKGVLVEPKPAVVVDGFADSAIHIKVKAWVESRGGWVKVKSRLLLNLKNKLDEYGINIPLPMRTVVYDKDIAKAEKMMEELSEPKPELTPQVTMPAPQPTPAVQPIETPEQLKPLDETI